MAAWGAEGLGFALAVRAYSPEASWLAGVFNYSLGSLVGGLTMLPGGLLATEGALAGLLGVQGLDALDRQRGRAGRVVADDVLEQSNDIRIIALETAIALHQSMNEAQLPYLQGVDVHKWPDQVRALYRQILKDLTD